MLWSSVRAFLLSVCVCLASKFKNMLRIYELNKKRYLRKVCVTWFHYHLVFFLGSTLPKNGNKIHKPCITHVPTTGWHHVPRWSARAHTLFFYEFYFLIYPFGAWRHDRCSLKLFIGRQGERLVRGVFEESVLSLFVPFLTYLSYRRHKLA